MTKAWKRFWLLVGGVALTAMGLFAQREFRVYTALEAYDNVELPPDYQRPAEWVFGRLMYPPHPLAQFSRPIGYGGRWDWREGGTSWAQDYPRADRQFARAMNRLTRVDARSVEQPINLDDGDDVYNWPWLAAGEMGDWKLTESQAARLRDFLLRGGFLMLDDFWGTEEWNRFNESMRVVFPDRPDCRDSGFRSRVSRDLRSGRSLPGAGAMGFAHGDDVPARRL